MKEAQSYGNGQYYDFFQAEEPGKRDADRTRKRKRSSKADEFVEELEEPLYSVSEEAMVQSIPDNFEASFVNAVFEIGLSRASPKVLMNFMPRVDMLTTEHIKSHLQKYRLHHGRSKNEFMEHYNQCLKADFRAFCDKQSWRYPSTSQGGESAGVEERLKRATDKLNAAATTPKEDPDSTTSTDAQLDTKRLDAILETMAEQTRVKVDVQEKLQKEITTQMRLRRRIDEV
uniref:HTH myb-type domain-containing protein n=1 Tax=Pinguiococcus pyrenoidosus TaxID=172671 RepID=A0A7R9YFR2_9STRA|mmetsp:Transcript_9303/g.34846  ORF Transcript_9303/g.34846 Transcript_9303/m.34846 type:complete len:230 (+) Transcript_9303:187-876(+)